MVGRGVAAVPIGKTRAVGVALHEVFQQAPDLFVLVVLAWLVLVPVSEALHHATPCCFAVNAADIPVGSEHQPGGANGKEAGAAGVLRGHAVVGVQFA